MTIDEEKIKEYQAKVGLRIKELRKINKLSQSELAARCNFEKTSISRIENNRVNITLKTILILLAGLETNIKDFFDFD